MNKIKRFSRGYHQNGSAWIMCALCFEVYDALPAHSGGMWARDRGQVTDICVDCAANEWLYFANLMGA